MSTRSPKPTRRAPGARGQAMTETMVVMSFLTLIIFGFVHMCMLAATKSVVSLAAFSAARTVMVRGSEMLPDSSPYIQAQLGWTAAWQVIDNLRWWSDEDRNRPDLPIGIPFGQSREGLTVSYRVPFGFPIFSVPDEGLKVTAFSPFVIQPAISEDNSDNGDQ